ncbi:MAG: 16S rRNA (guanine(966)-N(2))-methyltransferase RsmD [Clostridia bacterium]|nr:16S rRNA (guanine(966)-N(2))-methyltransferase RsmD [Clostridia bacterium]
MRIIGGKYKSRVLAEFQGEAVRPTSDRAREALFNILALKTREARVLDLFCGSGALGLEAYSRGASEVVFNDLSKDSLAILKKNLTALKALIGKEIKVLNYDGLSCLEVVKGEFDIILIDPPYKYEQGAVLLDRLVKRGLLSKSGVIVYEWDKPLNAQISGLECYDERKYGKAYFTFFRKQQEEK